jgi:hypothetical protein
MKNPVTTITGQHAQQRPIRAPHDPPAPPGPQPGSITLPRHAIPPGHEPESQQLSHNLKPDDPLVRSTNTDHRTTPIRLHDGLLTEGTSHRSGQPAGEARMYPMIRQPRSGLPQRRPGSTAAAGHARGPAGDRVPGRAGGTAVTGPA